MKRRDFLKKMPQAAALLVPSLLGDTRKAKAEHSSSDRIKNYSEHNEWTKGEVAVIEMHHESQHAAEVTKFMSGKCTKGHYFGSQYFYKGLGGGEFFKTDYVVRDRKLESIDEEIGDPRPPYVRRGINWEKRVANLNPHTGQEDAIYVFGDREGLYEKIRNMSPNFGEDLWLFRRATIIMVKLYEAGIRVQNRDLQQGILSFGPWIVFDVRKKRDFLLNTKETKASVREVFICAIEDTTNELEDNIRAQVTEQIEAEHKKW